MADVAVQNPVGLEETVDNVRDRRNNLKAHKRLGLDNSARKQSQMLGLDEAELDRAVKEASEHGALASGPSLEIPEEQLRAQRRARRRQRALSCELIGRERGDRENQDIMTSTSQENVAINPHKTDSDLSIGYESGNDPESDGKAYTGPVGGNWENWAEESDEDDENAYSLDRDNFNADEEPRTTPRRYYYYYYDGQTKKAKRRRSMLETEHTPMMDKKADRKALEVLGIDPSEEKVMDVLGLEDAQQLEAAVASLVPAVSDLNEVPIWSNQSKALSTLGLPTPPSKSDFILGRFQSPQEQSLFDLISASQLQGAFI